MRAHSVTNKEEPPDRDQGTRATSYPARFAAAVLSPVTRGSPAWSLRVVVLSSSLPAALLVPEYSVIRNSVQSEQAKV